jgi:acyl carrier protein
MNDEIRNRLLDFVVAQFGIPAAEIDVDASMVDQGVIDSIGLIEISGFIEDTFGMHIDEAEMTRDNFGSLNKMAAFIVHKQGI